MKHCKDCVLWRPPEEPQDYGLPEDYGYGKCLQPTPKGSKKEEWLPTGLFYEDDSGCYSLYTGPEFGCTNFKESKPWTPPHHSCQIKLFNRGQYEGMGTTGRVGCS